MIALLRRILSTPEGLAGAIILVALGLVALLAPALFPRDPLSIAGPPLLPPFQDWSLPLGTDRLGRDVLAGIVHGARTSLAVALAAAAMSIVVGAIVGTAAGFAGGLADEVLMRVADAFQTVPGFLLALAFVSVVGPSLGVVVIAIALSAWTGPARVTRAEVLSIRERDYVAAARVIGMRPSEIAFREVLPNALPPVLALSPTQAICCHSRASRCGSALSAPSGYRWDCAPSCQRNVALDSSEVRDEPAPTHEGRPHPRRTGSRSHHRQDRDRSRRAGR